MSKCLRVYRKQYIDEGCFGAIYRISARRIVKVYHADFSKEQILQLIDDELQGSCQIPYGLPILKIVHVIAPHWSNKQNKYIKQKTKGLIKRYIPYSVSDAIANNFIGSKNLKRIWDLKSDNLRKDTRGRIYIVDTQLNPYCS